jgi:isocitrate dehydrogenase
LLELLLAIAACYFSTDSTGECVVVKKEHVDWVRDFLIRCYDNDIFQLKQFVANERKFSTVTDDVVKQTATLVKKYPMIIKLLLEK